MPEPCRHYIIMKSHDDIRCNVLGSRAQVEWRAITKFYDDYLGFGHIAAPTLSHIITFFAIRKRHLCRLRVSVSFLALFAASAPRMSDYASRNRIFIARTNRRRIQPFPKWHQNPTNATHRRHGHFDWFYCRFHLTFASCRRTSARHPAGPMVRARNVTCIWRRLGCSALEQHLRPWQQFPVFTCDANVHKMYGLYCVT